MAVSMLNLYTWFPFKFGRCGEVQEITLLDERVFKNNGRFLEKAHLYPPKLPKYFMGCPIKCGTFGINPAMIMKENYTQNDCSTEYELTGLSVEILKFVCEKMNLITRFIATSLNFELDSFVTQIAELDNGLSDVTGIVPLFPVFVKSSFDATIPYIHVNMKMLVPCPKAIPGTGKVLTIVGVDDNWPCAVANNNCVLVCR